ncbi:MAG: LacI family DNA-binding transcriptional regulator [Anaerolineae bacterium]|nr:LacI family DNA-binding transcriptional regulator [Anaerolineae bacterium]
MIKKRPTQHQIAKEAGVSRTTVSLVLNNSPDVRVSPETRQRIHDVAERLNYYPDAAARSLVSGRTQTIGFVLCQSYDRIFADSFLPEVLCGVGQAVQENGYRALLHAIADVTSPQTYINLVREKHIDGIILSGPRSDDQQLFRLKDENFPVVMLGQLPGSHIPFVDVDNVGAATLAVNHLIKLGYKRIGMITNAPLQYTAAFDRLSGYRQALEQAGIPIEKELVQIGNFTEESGRKRMGHLLDLSNPPTAVFVASDLVAFGALAVIKERKLRVPEDVALVGYDDVQLAHYVDPPLTTIKLPAYELGYQAAKMLIQLTTEEPIPTQELFLKTELVIRQSCGASTQESIPWEEVRRQKD